MGFEVNDIGKLLDAFVVLVERVLAALARRPKLRHDLPAEER